MNNDTPADAITQAEQPTIEAKPITKEMWRAYIDWELPTQFDAGNPIRSLGLIRSAYFAGWAERERRTPSLAAQDGLVDALRVAVDAAKVWQDGGDLHAIEAFEEWLPKAEAALASIEVKS